MSFRWLLLLLLMTELACAFSGHAALARLKPTPPNASQEPLDVVLSATLRGALAKPWKAVRVFRQQPRLVVLRDSDYVTASILPSDLSQPFVILTGEEVSEIADWNGDFIYVRLELRAFGNDHAEVLLEFVRTASHCCHGASRLSAMASLELEADGWKVKGFVPYQNPAHQDGRSADSVRD